MRRTTSRPERWFLLPLLILVAVLAGACGRSPVAPTASTRPSLMPVSISIRGTTALQHPGDIAQLDAVASFADGTTRNIANDAGWTVDRWGIVSVVRGGLTAQAYGQCYVTAIYGALSARALVRVIPDGMFLVSGRVTEESGMPLWQARVRMTSSMDQMSTATDTHGLYMLPARGDSEVRAEMDDFEPQLKRFTVARDEQLDFQLKFNGRGFGGVYRLIFLASAPCALPTDVMRRTYIARVTESDPRALVVALSGAEFVVWGEPGFVGRREGSTLRFEISSDYSSEYQFIEWLDANRELAVSGTATAAMAETFVATFSGSVVVRRPSGATLARCEAGDHRLEFTR